MPKSRTILKDPFIYQVILAVFMLIAFAFITVSFVAAVHAEGQERFTSPEGAFKALVNAVRGNDTAALLAIFGPGGKSVISSGDAVADTEARKRFVKSAEEGIKFSRLDEKTVLASIGKENWCFPIPIVKSGEEWVFSTEEGREEILNRRIGRNELNTIEVALAYVEAQREYAGKDRTGDGIAQYAQHFLSRRGKRDGLYWEIASGEEMSPLGPLIARAAEEGYPVGKDAAGRRMPYHGYYFNILKRQGSNAPGGKFDYIVNGRMTAGFGLLAYPAEYGVSGIMTFMVNQQGIVYEKDLGTSTVERAKEIVEYDPDKTWKRAGQTSKPVSPQGSDR